MYDVLGGHLQEVCAHLGPLDVPRGEEYVAVVFHQERVVLLQEGEEIIGQLLSQWFAVGNEGNGSHLGDGLGKERPHEEVGGVRYDECIEVRGVAVENGLNVGALAEEIDVHGGFAGRRHGALDGFARKVQKNHVVAVDVALVVLGRRDQYDVVLQFPGEVAAVAGDVLVGRQVMADLDEYVHFVRVLFEIAHG